MKRRSLTSPSNRSALRSTMPTHPILLVVEPAVFPHELEIAPDRRERRAQLVRDRRNEVVLHAIEVAQPLVLLGKLAQKRVALDLVVAGNAALPDGTTTPVAPSGVLTFEVSKDDALRVIAALMLLCQTSFLFGHAGELVSVVQRGFFSAPTSLFSENPHMFFAKFALFPIIASELLLIVLTVTAAVQRLLRRSPRVTGGQASTSA